MLLVCCMIVCMSLYRYYPNIWPQLSELLFIQPSLDSSDWRGRKFPPPVVISTLDCHYFSSFFSSFFIIAFLCWFSSFDCLLCRLKHVSSGPYSIMPLLKQHQGQGFLYLSNMENAVALPYSFIFSYCYLLLLYSNVSFDTCCNFFVDLYFLLWICLWVKFFNPCSINRKAHITATLNRLGYRKSST